MPFEDELGDALRRTGDGFTTDQRTLIDGGERRGRRMVARRRAAVVTGTVLVMAVVGGIGAYSGGLIGGAGDEGGSTGVNVAALPAPGAGSGAVTAEQMTAKLKALMPPGGQLTGTEARGTADGPMAYGVYDDGKGQGAVSIGLYRTDPQGPQARELTECPEKRLVDFESCTSERLPDGSRLLLLKGYEYPDRREDTKCWRATLVTPQGFLVDASEWNAAAQKGAPVSRPEPPLSLDRMKTLVTSTTWHDALNDLPPAGPQQTPPAASPVDAPVVLRSLLKETGIPVTVTGGESDYGYAVLDDGKGESMVQVNVQAGMGEALEPVFAAAGTVTLPDGTKVRTEQGPGEKGWKNVVKWTVDTLRPDGRRVVISAFNSGSQNSPTTRSKPALTMEQLKELALDPKWFG
ncbi:hypothetical protein [Streptomyces sp. NPDC012888]|uniref:hypothetical protein n=1 Tax=Streptomyces sp. NPDC012888 TaxID=3364855 RepID=UPI0036CD9E2C